MTDLTALTLAELERKRTAWAAMIDGMRDLGVIPNRSELLTLDAIDARIELILDRQGDAA